MHVSLVSRLAEWSRAAGEPAVLADRPDATVVRSGGVVLKAHAARTDGQALAARLRLAAHPLLTGILLTPLAAPVPWGPSGSGGPPPAAGPSADGASGADPLAAAVEGPVAGRYVTRWPYGLPVPPDRPDAAPWDAAGRLAARLHSVPVGDLSGPLPPMGGPANAARAVARLRECAPLPGAEAVLRAWERLPGWARDEEPRRHPRAALCHGDLHLGQLVRYPAPDGPWRLIDIDDLGPGNPAWDLARLAAGYATGLITATDWSAFLAAYRAEGGPAVARDSGPWPPEVDAPARALTVQLAARALTDAATGRRPLDGTDRDLLAACARIATAPEDGTPVGQAP